MPFIRKQSLLLIFLLRYRVIVLNLIIGVLKEISWRSDQILSQSSRESILIFRVIFIVYFYFELRQVGWLLSLLVVFGFQNASGIAVFFLGLGLAWVS